MSSPLLTPVMTTPLETPGGPGATCPTLYFGSLPTLDNWNEWPGSHLPGFESSHQERKTQYERVCKEYSGNLPSANEQMTYDRLALQVTQKSQELQQYKTEHAAKLRQLQDLERTKGILSSEIRVLDEKMKDLPKQISSYQQGINQLKGTKRVQPLTDEARRKMYYCIFLADLIKAEKEFLNRVPKNVQARIGQFESFGAPASPPLTPSAPLTPSPPVSPTSSPTPL